MVLCGQGEVLEYIYKLMQWSHHYYICVTGQYLQVTYGQWECHMAKDNLAI